MLYWVGFVLLVPCSLIRTREQSEYCLPKQRENNTKQRVKYISVAWASALTGTPALPVSYSASLFTKAQASWKQKTETRNSFSSANTHSSTLLSTTLFILQGGMTQTTQSISTACSSCDVWRSPGWSGAQDVAASGLILLLWGCFPKSRHSLTLSFMATLGRAVIRYNPCPDIAGEAKAQAVRCFPHCSVYLPTGTVLGNAFQRKTGQIHLAVTPCKLCLRRTDEVLCRNTLLPSP